MARLIDDVGLQKIRSPENDARIWSPGEGRPVHHPVRNRTAEALGYLWATFLVAASGTETLLSRLLTRRR